MTKTMCMMLPRNILIKIYSYFIIIIILIKINLFLLYNYSHICGVFLNLCYVVIEKHTQEKVHGKSLLKIVFTSFNVTVFIFIPFKCLHFMCSHI